jgi:small subunit ribosomal protein S20
MPIKKSAKKALRQSLKRRKRNLKKKEKIKALIKKVKRFLAENKIKEAKEILPQIYKALDKAAKTGLIKKNTASRKKSRITKLINSKSLAIAK